MIPHILVNRPRVNIRINHKQYKLRSSDNNIRKEWIKVGIAYCLGIWYVPDQLSKNLIIVKLTLIIFIWWSLIITNCFSVRLCGFQWRIWPWAMGGRYRRVTCTAIITMAFCFWHIDNRFTSEVSGHRMPLIYIYIYIYIGVIVVWLFILGAVLWQLPSYSYVLVAGCGRELLSVTIVTLLLWWSVSTV